MDNKLTKALGNATQSDKRLKSKSAKKDHCTLINIFYKSKEDMHITHNVQRSLDKSVHDTIGEFYLFVEEFIDGFVESVFGIYGPKDICFKAEVVSNPKLYLEKLYSIIETERKFFKESWIQNEIDNFQKQIALSLYKLKYVKSEPKV